jgi:hypothetical protein
LNLRRWLIVGYLLALMAGTTFILLIPGRTYRTLTTSDSGWFYDIAFDINNTNGFVENNRLSHAPYGMAVSDFDQGQPLMTVMLYRAAHAIDNNVGLTNVVQYWSPLLFALTLIPIFLIGKELGGDLAGCLAAFFAAFLTGSIYWMKFGAFDREASQTILGAWVVYLSIKMFKSPRLSILKFALLAGSVYGIFWLVWGAGALYLSPVIVGGLLLVLLVGFIGKLVRRVAGLVKPVIMTIRENFYLIVGVVGSLLVLTFVAVVVGQDNPNFWIGFTQTLLGYVGIKTGGGGVSLTRYASEQAAPSGWGDTLSSFYNWEFLTAIVLTLGAIALVKICYSRKRWELLMIPWLIILAGLVWPGRGQVRFDRLWWPLIPVLAGAGFVALVSVIRQAPLKIPSAAVWLDRIQKPLVIALVAIIVASPFITNAYATANVTTPPTIWGGISNFDSELISSFNWLRENTADNSVIAVEWSYGHLATGVSRRMTVCDGTETVAEQGKWENTTGIHPPDYIYYTKGNVGYIYGIDVPAVPFAINGRRIDVQRLPFMDDREFRFIVETYRDNYRCQIDYVLFYNAWITSQLSYEGLWYPAYSLWSSGYWKEQTTSFENDEAGNQIFHFTNGGNIVLDAQGNVYLQTDNTQKSLAGFVAIYLDNNGNFMNLNFSYPTPTPDIPETLLVFYEYENNDVLVRPFYSANVAPSLIDLSVPMDVRLFAPIFYGTDYLAGIDYWLENVYTSPGGQITIARVNYVPQPISPSDNTIINDNTPTFRWSMAIDSTKYEFWLDSNINFNSPKILENTTELTFTPVAAEALPDGTYYWRVRGYDNNNNPTDWSPVSTFVLSTVAPPAPLLVSPKNGAVENNLTQTFTWTQPEPNVTYWIQIANDAGFSQPFETENSAVTDNSYTYTFSRNGTYYWRVLARDVAHNLSDWSENFPLTILAAPGQPTLLSPTNGAINNDNAPTFVWTPGSNADNHLLLIDNDNDFSSPEENLLLGPAVNTYQVAPENSLPDGIYSWKVIAINKSSENESAVWKFTIDTVPPGVPAPLAPLNGNTIRENTPTFDWSDVTDPSGITYMLEIATDNAFTSIIFSKTGILASSYAPTSADLLLQNGTYYWHVRAIDGANNYGDFSPVQSFTVNTLA